MEIFKEIFFIIFDQLNLIIAVDYLESI